MSGSNVELIAWGKMLGGREQELADALEAAEAETDAAKTVRQIGEIAASTAMSPQQALSVLGIYGRIASAEAERDAALATVERVRMKAIALTCLTGHWRGYDFDGGSEFAGESILEIIKAAK